MRRPGATAAPTFRMFAFDGLREAKSGCGCLRQDVGGGYGSFGVVADRIGRLAAGSVLLLADRARFEPIGGEVGQTTGDLYFRRRRTARLVDAVDVIGIPEAVALRQDAVVELTDLDARVPQGTRVLMPTGTLATVLSAATGSTGVVASVPGAAPTGQEGGLQPPPEGAWWARNGQDEEEMPSWLKWGLVVVGVGLVGYVGWQTWKERG